MLKYFVIFVLCVKCSFSDDLSSIVWNIREKDFTNFYDLQQQQSSTPLILFTFKSFNLAQFGKHASVYSTANDGGTLKRLKKVVDSSKGYLVTNEEVPPNVWNSDSAIVYHQSIEDDLLQKSNVIIVNVDSWQNLDDLVHSVSSHFKNGNYVAVLTNQHANSRKKREAKTVPFNRFANMTYINNTHCLLYARRAWFVIQNFTDVNKAAYYKFVLPRFVEAEESDCSNYSGSFVYNMNGSQTFPVGKHNLTLTKLQLVMHIKLNEALAWWSVALVDVVAEGTVIQPNGSLSMTFNNTGGYAEGAKGFAYACGQQRPFMFYFKPEGDKAIANKYGLAFDDLQMQPFKLRDRGRKDIFTDDVYDCVPFISIAIWMFLVCAAILLIIIFCGISMISSLKTMDRFDDPKGKGLVVNVKE